MPAPKKKSLKQIWKDAVVSFVHSLLFPIMEGEVYLTASELEKLELTPQVEEALNAKKASLKDHKKENACLTESELVKLGTNEQIERALKRKKVTRLTDAIAPSARSRKTSYERDKVWYEHERDTMIELMTTGPVIVPESVVKRTEYKLVPDLKMESDAKGKLDYERLVERYGLEWVKENVEIEHQTIPEHVVVSYKFTGEGSTEEQLEWTLALGNKPALKIGPPTKRIQQGKERRTNRKK